MKESLGSTGNNVAVEGGVGGMSGMPGTTTDSGGVLYA